MNTRGGLTEFISRLLLLPVFLLRGYSRPGVYGLQMHDGLEQIYGTSNVKAGDSAVIQVAPTECEFFNIDSVYMFGVDPEDPTYNRRFLVTSVKNGDEEQLCTRNRGGLLSDVYNRTDQPVRVEWGDVSQDGLTVRVENMHDTHIKVFVVVWGTPVDRPGRRGWLRAFFRRNVLRQKPHHLAIAGK